MVQTVDVIYQSASFGEQGPADGVNWNFLGNAKSSSMSTYFWSLLKAGNASIVFARVVFIWNPNTGTSPTGIRLVSADDGPVNLIEICQVTQTNYTNPRVDAVDMTTALQALLAAGQYKHLGFQTSGNGGNGPIVYGVRLEIVWG